MEAEKLTVKDLLELLGKLKLGQFWSLVVLLFALASGVFASGYKVAATLQEGKTAGAQVKLEEAEKQRDGLRAELVGMKKKERFLALFLRYELAKDQVLTARLDSPEAGEAPEKLEKELAGARAAFDEYLLRNIDPQPGERAPDLRTIKGGGRNAVVKLGDGTLWTLPTELTAPAAAR